MKSRKMNMAEHVARTEEVRNTRNSFVGKTQSKKPLGRPRRRWEDNIEIDLTEIWQKCVHWIHLAQDRDQWRALFYTVTNLRVP
jgi:hypothetical protein